MTTGPRLRVGGHLLPGVLAVALFGLIALVVLNTPFEGMAGYPDGISVTAEVGYALLDFTALQSGEGAIGDTEHFLVSFFLMAVVLDAALDASLVLAKREEAGEVVSPYASSGGSDSGAQPATDGGSELPEDERGEGE
ncbi:hypothetical protein [Saliphagus sp. LR7]|uniref:hypothetical protein n=1 Tax=Saliphagus sp. LR7 TaxID=2282654 RepID=UPI000DF728D6|nr:hypothetical protein [Saliphagus sp. LR7]